MLNERGLLFVFWFGETIDCSVMNVVNEAVFKKCQQSN